MAFPSADVSDPGIIPTGGDLATPDVRDLQHQMGLASGFASLGSQQGWTILPRISAEEAFSDNIMEVPSPRRWDLTTILAPGVAVLGNSERAQLRLNYQPVLEMHVRTGSENVLEQQLNAVGTLTVLPDMFFVDVRALAGVQATNGGVGGIGGLGQGSIGGVTGSSIIPSQTSDLGLAKGNKTQTASVSVSPYMLYRFGDIGTGKVGVSVIKSSSSSVTGFAPLPLVQNGPGGAQELTATEETANFQTGDEFAALRDTFSADGRQSTTSGNAAGGASTRNIANDRLDYQINHSIDLYGQLGWEDIVYTGANAVTINGMTWGLGTILTPDPDSQLTLGYGHQNGRNTMTASARYALTARTTLTANYTNGIGTQLEQVQNQLEQASVANNGTLVNSQTGAPLFSGNNALGVSAGVFRYSYLTFGATTILDRDTFRLTISDSQQSQAGARSVSKTSAVATASATWTHQFDPNLVGTATTSYSTGSPTAGANTKSLVMTLSLQYILSDTVSTFARYTFYNVASSTAGQSWYQDLFVVGITKQF